MILLIYSITIATQSQKLVTPQVSRFKNSQPTMSQTVKPRVKKNSEQVIVNQAS